MLATPLAAILTTSLSFLITPTVLPYTIPGTRKITVIKNTIPLIKGDGINDPVSASLKTPPGRIPIPIIAATTSNAIPAFFNPLISIGESSVNLSSAASTPLKS